LKKVIIKYQFSIIKKDELDKLSHEELLKYVKNLQDNIEQEKPPKNSTNSGIPTSLEIFTPKRNQSIRKKGGKNGAQFGHIGKTLKQSDTPDEIVDVAYNINNCKKCNYDLSEILKELREKRQILDLDIANTNQKIIQFQSYSKKCPNCGYNNHDNSYPKLVIPNISYGKNLMAIVSYLNVVHYLSYARIVEALHTMYKITISEGSVDNLIKKASRLSKPQIDKIVSQLELSDIVGIDETGAKINGKKDWHWTFQNDSCTYIVHDESRAAKVINDNFNNGFINATVIHDNFRVYDTLNCKDEQLCLAHKLRDLNYAIECDDTQVMKDIKALIIEAMIFHKEDLEPFQRASLKVQYIIALDKLLETKTIPKSETHKQIKSFTKASNKIFTFLLYPNVPPDNNGSDRAIRNIKVKQKVSHQYKSSQGAKDYATLRSIIDTARKRDINEFEAIRNIVGGGSIF
jgi:hypothetical protein